MIVPSIRAATYRGTRTPSVNRARPEEYMSSTDPPTSPSTATITNGMRYQVGSRLASAPIGSAPIAAERAFDEPASSRPKITRTIGAIEEPNAVQPTTPRPEDRLGR